MVTKATDPVLDLVSPPIQNAVINNLTIGAGLDISAATITGTVPLQNLPASSSQSGGGLCTVYTYAGNPNGAVTGVAAVDGVNPPDLVWDTSDKGFWVCENNGNNHWKAITSRFVLYNNLNLYVSPTGSDSNTGMSPAHPFLTLQEAWNTVLMLDLNGWNVNINVADGTYAPVYCAGIPVGTTGSTSVNFIGDVDNPGNCLVSATGASCFTATQGAAISVQGFGLTATTAGNAGDGCGLIAYGIGSMVHTLNQFQSCDIAHVSASSGSFINCGLNNNGTYTIVGGSNSHGLANFGGYLGFTNSVATLTGSPAFPGGFMIASDTSVIYAPGFIHHGSATGPRYLVNHTSTIDTVGGGANVFPGSSAGTADSASYGFYG